MNILITTHAGNVAGSTYSIFYLASGLKEKGHNIYLAVSKGKLLHKLAMKASIECVDIDFNKKLDISSMRKIKQAVRRFDIDLIYAQESRDRYNAIFSKIFYALPCKIILARRQRVADNNILKRWLHVKFSEKIVVISEGLKKIVEKKGFPSNHLSVIYNGLPTDQYVLQKEKIYALQKLYGIKPDRDIIIGCVARPKLQNELVEALKILPDHFRILFVGLTKEIFYRKFSSTDISMLEDRIIFAGIIEDKLDVIHHYALMDVHVLPSKMDGFGLVSVEAMAMGVPCIGSDYGGIPDVIKHNESGFIYTPGGIKQLADQINEVVSNKDLRSKFIKNGFDRALNKFSISRTIDNYESLFEALISK